MARKGLDKTIVLNMAVTLVETQGYARFSMHALAAALGVKTASLYNHISGATEVYTAIGKTAVTQFRQVIEQASANADEERARLMDIAVAMRQQARTTPEMYRVLMDLPLIQGGEIRPLGQEFINPMADALRPFAVDEVHLIHLTRAYRSMIHGFIAYEQAGYFAMTRIAADESYRLMMASFVQGLGEPHAIDGDRPKGIGFPDLHNQEMDPA